MGTRYSEGDTVIFKDEDQRYEVLHIIEPESDSPDYVIQDDNGLKMTVKASEIQKDTSRGWKEEAVRQLETRFDTRLDQRSEKPNVGDSKRSGFVAYGDEYEFDVFKTREKARRNAEQEIKEDVEMYPESFADWVIEDNVYVTDTDARSIAQDNARARAESRDFRSDSDREEWEVQKADELKKEIKRDPIGYFEDIYGKDNVLDQDFIRIDSKEVAKDVISNDGIVQAVSIYGEQIELKEGVVAYKVI